LWKKNIYPDVLIPYDSTSGFTIINALCFMFLQYSCKLFLFKFLYILKYLQKTPTTYISVTLQLQPLFAHETEFLLPLSGKIPFRRDNLCYSIPNFNFTIHSHSFSVTHIFKPSLFSANTWMEMEQTSTDGANNGTILWNFNTIYICSQVCCKFNNKNKCLESINICCCMCFLVWIVSSWFILYQPH